MESSIEEVLLLQSSLAALLDRIAEVQDDQEKLQAEKKFLEDYIGNLMVRPRRAQC